MATLSAISPVDGADRAVSPAPRIAAAAVLGAVAVAALYSAWSDIARFAYYDEEASHILMVPVVLAWLMYVRRRYLQTCRLQSSWLGPVVVVGGWLIAHLGFNHSIQCFWHAGAVLVLLGCLLSVLGLQAFVAVWPAVLVAAFLVPIPATVRLPLAWHLQTMTAAATAWLMSAVGFDVARATNQLIVNGHPVLVAEACNGLRLVFPLFLVIYVFCFSLPLRAWIRAALILGSPLVAVGCNVLRLVPTVWLFGHASQETAHNFHDISGWAMIVVAFLILMLFIKVLEFLGIPVMVKPQEAR